MSNAPVLLTISALTLSSYHLLASEYHVAGMLQSSSDSNPGTLAQPWKTISKAALTVEAGDTVLIHGGTYRESVVVPHPGTASKPIVFRAFKDEEVILDGADIIPPEQWHSMANTKHTYTTAAEHDPGQLLMDNRPIYAKVEPVSRSYPRTYKRGLLADADRNLYQFKPETKELLLNLNGDSPTNHVIGLPVRATGFSLSSHCQISGIRASHYFVTAIAGSGDDSVVEDCLLTENRAGITVGGWNRRGVIVRRNTVIDGTGNGIWLVDRPVECLVQDNLVLRCALNHACEDGWFGGIKMNSAADTTFLNNIVLEGGNPDTDGGVDGPALWGDINVDHIMYLGNTCANNKEAGIYVEFAMGDTKAYFNTSYRNGHGITCRASQRGMFMRNLILENRTSGLAVWAAEPPYDTSDNVFAHNLVRDCSPSLRFQTEYPILSDYNTFWPENRNKAPFAVGQAGATFSDLTSWIKVTGHDIHSQIKDAQPADVGLDTVTFRVPDAKDAQQVLMMVGNGSCDYENPTGQDLLPYFWRPGSGDGANHRFSYAAYCGLAGGVQAQAYDAAGGTVGLKGDLPSVPQQTRLAHSGLRCLEIDGQRPSEMCKEGLGFWSPSLPARPGDSFDISYFARGKDLQPVGLVAVAGFAEFTNATGQHRTRVPLPSGIAPNQPLTGTFPWTRLSAMIRVPADAKRMRVFLGLAPAKGSLLLDDLGIKVR